MFFLCGVSTYELEETTLFLGPGIYFSTRPDALQRSVIFFLSTQHKNDTGATFDSVLNFERHASLVTLIFVIFIVLKNFLPTEHTKILVNAFVTSRLDKCNSLLYGLPYGLLHK